MAKLVKAYVGELFRKFQRFAPWLPDVPIQLGAVGVIEAGEFRRKTTLRALGIKVTASPKGPAVVIDHASTKGVTVTMKAKGVLLAGSPLTKADIGASVTFSDVGGVVLQASGVKAQSISNADEVGQEILERYKNQTWDDDWVFVDEVRTAEATTILISEASASRLDLRALGKVAEKVPLSGSFSIVAKEGSVTSFIGQSGLTPLFHLSRVKKKWLDTFLLATPKGKIAGAKGATPVGRGKVPTSAKNLLEDVSFEEE